MRIQETDRILKEARLNRHAAGQRQEDAGGVLSRAWRMISKVFKR